MRRVFTEEQDAEVGRRYLAGETLAELAASYGVCTSSVVGALKRRDIRRRGPRVTRSTQLTSEQEREIIERFLSDDRVHALAKEFGIGHKRLYKILEDAGHKPLRGPRSGPRHSHWKGGRTPANSAGYINQWIPPDHPFASMRGAKGRVMEHRLVMAEALGRPLTADETVHHVNGVKSDNRLENLQLHRDRHGPGQLYQCMECGSFHVGPVPLERRTNENHART